MDGPGIFGWWRDVDGPHGLPNHAGTFLLWKSELTAGISRLSIKLLFIVLIHYSCLKLSLPIYQGANVKKIICRGQYQRLVPGLPVRFSSCL